LPGTEEFPIFYSEEEKANLKGSPFLTWLNEEIQDQKDDYEEICKTIPGFRDNFT
jgi:hypothetical protein